MSSCQTLPAWGLMQDGECWEQPTLALRIRGTESGLWPTPTASDNRPRATENSTARRVKLGKQVSLEAAVKFWPTPTAASNGPSKVGSKNPRGIHSGNALATAVVWRTPTVNDSKNNGTASQQNRQSPNLNAQVGGPLNPTWVEWLMGWPLEWTDLKPLAMDKFQQWQQQHSGY